MCFMCFMCFFFLFLSFSFFSFFSFFPFFFLKIRNPFAGKGINRHGMDSRGFASGHDFGRIIPHLVEANQSWLTVLETNGKSVHVTLY